MNSCRSLPQLFIPIIFIILLMENSLRIVSKKDEESTIIASINFHKRRLNSDCLQTTV